MYTLRRATLTCQVRRVGFATRLVFAVQLYFAVPLVLVLLVPLVLVVQLFQPGLAEGASIMCEPKERAAL